MSNTPQDIPPSSETQGDLEARLKQLSPVVDLLNQARDAIASPLGRTEAESPSQLDWKPPERLGDFELLSPIGRGGMGVVYEARNRSLDRIVALKVLPRSVLPDAEIDSAVESTTQQNLIKRFHVEARAAARLHHPHIVPVYGFGEDSGFYYFVMQRIYGLSLDRWIESQYASDNEQRLSDFELTRAAARFGYQAADALAYAHGEGILHRDVKPGNLLIDEDGNVQIADFGIAQVDDAEALTRTSDVVGTLRYMAPEQVIGESSPQSDVYSLGITLYEIVTGVPAVDDASVRNAVLLQKRPKGPVPLSKQTPNLPIDLRTIIEKAMMPNASDRYASANGLAEDLKRFLDGRPIVARRMPWWEQTSRWIQQNRAVSALASLVILTLSLAVAISIWGQTQVQSALDQEVVAKRSAQNTANLATSAMEEIFGRFSSSADAASVAFEATDFSAPAVDPKTASLLEDLLSYYDALAVRRSDPSQGQSRLNPGIARVNVGAIYQQLGDHQSAMEAYQRALREFGESDALIAARLHNRIGQSLHFMGLSQDANQQHRLALDVLQSDASRIKEPAIRFERARSQLLASRRVRPGMGPFEMPPRSSFEQDGLFSPGPRRRPGPEPPPGFGRGPGPLPVGGFGPDGDLNPPPRRPRPSPAEMRSISILKDSDAFRAAMDDMVKLQQELPNSIPVKLLLTTMVREQLGDSLIARANRESHREALDLSDEMERQLEGVIEQETAEGNDAAARFELIRLLTDFDVFRRLPPDQVDLGLIILDRVIPHAEFLVQRFPNVPAYESLAIHTWFKASILHTRRAIADGHLSDEEDRRIRSLTRFALQHQLHLVERNPEAHGYSLWCCLFLMRLGDLQFDSRDEPAAFRSYRRALRMLPLEGVSKLDQDPSPNRSTDTPDAISSYRAIRVAAPMLLRRFGELVSEEDAIQAELIATGFQLDGPGQWQQLDQAIESLLNEASLQTTNGPP